MAQAIKIGDTAPNFRLLSERGQKVELKDFIGTTPIILFFYPKDNTTVCTKEVCHFRDNFDEFKKIQNAEVLGISSDTVESHKQFSETHHLPFALLSDPGEGVRKHYGVPKTLGIVPGRVTYVIDKQGVVRHIFSSQLNYKRHVEEALRALKSI